MHFSRKVLFTLLVLVLYYTSSSIAAGDFYSGSCTSQKNWVFEAKEQMNKISSAIQTLKDDEDCTGIATVVQALDKSLPEKTSASLWQRSAKLNQEFKDLHHMYTQGNPSFQTAVQNILSQKILDKEGRKERISPLLLGQAGAQGVAGSLISIDQRASLTVNSALDGVSQFLEVLPNYHSCFVEKPEKAGIIMSGLLHMLGSFTGEGQGSITKLSQVTNQFFALFERNNFFGLLKSKLERQKLNSAMSCLVESTTTNYCSGNDAFNLLNFQTDLKSDNDLAGGLDASDSRLRGYNILTKELPKVSLWLQRVLNGSPPQMNSQAEFLGSVINSISKLQIDRLSIIGLLNEQTKLYRDLEKKSTTPLAAKRTQVLDILLHVIRKMYSGVVGVNFFNITLPARLAPFQLIGAELPAGLKGTDGVTKGWYEWLVDNLDTYAPIEDPSLALVTITKNLNLLLDQVMITGSQYFSTWFIPDPTMIVDEALSTQAPPTVYMSLVHIIDYLTHLMTETETKLQRARDAAHNENIKLKNDLLKLQTRLKISKASNVKKVENSELEQLKKNIVQNKRRYSFNKKRIEFATQPALIASIDDTKNKILRLLAAFQLRDPVAREILKKSEAEKFVGPYGLDYSILPDSILEILESKKYKAQIKETRDHLIQSIKSSREIKRSYKEALAFKKNNESKQDSDKRTGIEKYLGKGLFDDLDSNLKELITPLEEDIEVADIPEKLNDEEIFTASVVADVMAGKVDNSTLKEIDRAILQLAFEEFNVIIQRDTFLSNRILKYVQFEFLVDGILDESTPDHIRELMIVSSSNLVEQITALTQQNLQETRMDLAQAQIMNVTSLEVVAELAESVFIDLICDITKDIGGEPVNLAGCIKQDKTVKFYLKSKITKCGKYTNKSNAYKKCVSKILLKPKEGKYIKKLITLEYLQGGRRGNKEKGIPYLDFPGKQSKFREKEILRSKYCIQTLGFITRYRLFREICDGVVLKSQLSKQARYDDIVVDADYNKLFELSDNTQLQNTRTQNDEDRICSFRDHLRKNHVYFMVNSSR